MQDRKDKFVQILRDPQIDMELKRALVDRAPAFFGGEGNVDVTSGDLSKGRKKTYGSEKAISDVPDASLAEQQFEQQSSEPTKSETEVETETVIPVQIGDKGETFGKEDLLNKADTQLEKSKEIVSKYGTEKKEASKAIAKEYDKLSDNQKTRYQEMMSEADEKERLRNSYVARYEDALNEWHSSKIIPMRALQNTSTGVMIAMAAAQALSVVTGDKESLDRISNMINTKIERDIRLQEREIEMKGQKARNILSLMKVIVPENPEVLRNQARELYNNHLIMQVEKAKQRSTDADTQFKIQQLQMSLSQKNQELKLEIEKAAKQAAINKAELEYKYGTKVKTKTGQAKDDKAMKQLMKRSAKESGSVASAKTALGNVTNILKLIEKEDPILILEKLKGKVGMTSKLRSLLDSLKNAAIMAQTGTQTEGDAKRIIEEMEGRPFDEIEDLRDVFIPKIAKSLIQTLIELDNVGKLTKKDKVLLNLLKRKFGTVEKDIMGL